jgi:hypothetical protein
MLKRDYNKLLAKLSPDEQKNVKEYTLALAKGRTDPVFFAEYFLGLRFHPKQKIWLWLTTKTQIENGYHLAKVVGVPLPTMDELRDHPFLKNILCPSNRFGKTLMTAVKHIWYCFYKIGTHGLPDNIKDIRYPTLNISPHSMQVDAAYRYIVDIFDEKFIYSYNGRRFRNKCLIKNFLVDHKSVKREIIFANNSYIKGVPTGEDQASSLAGTQFFYISYDEAPQSLHLRNELPAKILSRLIDSGGPCDIIGTPEVDKPSHAYYQRIVKYGLKLEDGFFTMLGNLEDNIFIGDKERESSLLSIKQTDVKKYRQVAFGEFVTTGSKMFDNVVVDKVFGKELFPIQMGIPGHKYAVGADWGFADTGDPTVFYVIDYTDLTNLVNSDDVGKVYYKVAFHESIKGGNPYEVLAFLRLLQQNFNDADIIHDSSSMGGVIIRKMLNEMKVRHVHDFSATKDSKDELLFLLLCALQYGRQTETTADMKVLEKVENFGKLRSFIIPELEEQMINYRLDDKKIEQDEVMALGLAIWWLERKYSGRRTKVWLVNFLANKPEQILIIPEKRLEERALKTASFTINERQI